MTIENTSKRDPMIHLLGAMSDGTSAYIEGMEAAGQKHLVNSDRLPTDVQDGDEEYLNLGFTFGPADPADPMFRPAALPQGWKCEGSDHSMWSYLVDGLGRKRVSIFYKAAFYDRRAFMRLNTPYGYLNDVLYEGAEPVLDGEWLPAEVAIRELESIRDRLLVSAGESDGYAKSTGSGDYWTERAKEDRQLADKATAVLARIFGQVPR